ncbi:MAG: Tfp pilus assembly protein FimT/FimU, partial [Candidatus Poribacteria bacterium]
MKKWSSRFKSRSEHGFTLIEIMLVLTLIAILSAVTMPSMRGFTASSRLKSSAHAIRDMLNFA